MKILRPQSIVLGLSFCMLASGQALAQAYPQPLPATADSMPIPRAELPPTSASVVEPDAVEALRKMSRYLSSLNTAEVTSQGSLDIVTDEDQRVQMDAVTKYKMRKPGFVIDYDSDMKKRRFLYDGKQFTIYAPATGLYATVPAPGSNREVLAEIYDRYGIALPLEDLFRWGDPGGTREGDLRGAYHVGSATIDGVATDHYAFREDAVDWEVWIQRGDKPLPKKLVIVDRTDAVRPTFIARLDWTVNPALADGDFTFVPDKDAKRIELAIYEGE